MTAREFNNYPVTMTLISWLSSASATNKSKMENKTRKRCSKSTCDSVNREDKGKKMKMASVFIEKTNGNPLLRMYIASMFDGMVAVVKLRQNMETPTKPYSTELFYGGRLYSCDKAIL